MRSTSNSKVIILSIALAIYCVAFGIGRAEVFASTPDVSDGSVIPTGIRTLEFLAHLPQLYPSGVQARQFGSYDRTGGNNDGFDGRFSSLYKDANGEYVLFDVKQPGTLYRMWFTDMSTIRNLKFYFDGETVPRINTGASRLFTTKSAPYGTPLVTSDRLSSGGFISYLPFSFEKSLKITSTGMPKFYNMTYHTYDNGINVKSFEPDDDTSAARSFFASPSKPEGKTEVREIGHIEPGKHFQAAELKGEGQILEWKIKIPGLTEYTEVTGPQIKDDGRAHKSFSKFRVKIDPNNRGVKLVRRFDYGIADQVADIYVDGAKAGQMANPGSNGTYNWLNSEVIIPENLTKGKQELQIEVRFVSSSLDFNEFHYWAYSMMPDPVQTDEVDVANKKSEQEHSYEIGKSLWSGERAFIYPPMGDTITPGAKKSRSILENTWVVMDWDGGESEVEAPLGIFFGTGLGLKKVSSIPLEVSPGPDSVFTLRFPMPYGKSASVRLENRGQMPVDGLDSVVTYRDEPGFAAAIDSGRIGYFHGTYNKEWPTAIGRDYTILDTTGAGKFVGVSMLMSQSTMFRGYLEGDERVYIDGSRTPQIQGTGTEDYFNGGWYFNQGIFTLPTHGNTNHASWQIDETAVYRLHLYDSVPFYTSLKFGIEHGASNETTTDYSSVAYWYGQSQPSMKLTDSINVGDTVSEASHNYSINGAAADDASIYTVNSSFEGRLVEPKSSDSGRKVTTPVKFSTVIDPANRGIRIRRLADQSLINQMATVYIDGVEAGTWYTPGGNADRRWLETDYDIPAKLTSGKSKVNIEIVPATAENTSGWTEFYYQIFSFLR